MGDQASELESVLTELEVMAGDASTDFCSKVILGEAEALRRRISAIKTATEKPVIPEPAPPKASTKRADFSEDHVAEGASEDEDSGHLSDPEEELCREARLKVRVAELKEQYGVADERFIKKVQKLVSVLIAQYKLDATDEYLDMITEAVTARGESDPLYIKTIQSRAFCLWKRYKYKDALKLFHEQERIMGPSAALCENIGHTYNSLGDYEAAEKYFVQAMEMLKMGSFGNKGGIYLGLGLVRERLGKTKEALPILQQALSHYQDEYNRGGQQLDSSLIAKSHMSVAHAHENLGELSTAIYHVREALRVFRNTVGNNSPLVANALGSLGRMLQASGDLEEADTVLRHALGMEVKKDAFHLETIFKLLNNLKDLHTSQPKKSGSLQDLHSKVLPLLAPIQEACRRIDQLQMVEQHTDDGTVAVFYKTAGELLMLAGLYTEAVGLLDRAGKMLKEIKDFDCSSLIESVEYMSVFAKGQLKTAPATAAPVAAAPAEAQQPEEEKPEEELLNEPLGSGGPMRMSMPPAHDATDLDGGSTSELLD